MLSRRSRRPLSLPPPPPLTSESMWSDGTLPSRQSCCSLVRARSSLGGTSSEAPSPLRISLPAGPLDAACCLLNRARYQPHPLALLDYRNSVYSHNSMACSTSTTIGLLTWHFAFNNSALSQLRHLLPPVHPRVHLTKRLRRLDRKVQP